MTAESENVKFRDVNTPLFPDSPSDSGRLIEAALSGNMPPVVQTQSGGMQPAGIRSRWAGAEQTPVQPKSVEKKTSGKRQRMIFFTTLIIVAPILAAVSAVLSDKKFSHCMQDPKQGAMLSRSVGRLCENNGWDDLASMMFMQAYRLNPKEVQSWVDDAHLKHSRGDFAGAMQEYIAINKVSPSARSYNNLGCIYQDYGKVDKAIDCFTMALDLDPHWAFASNNRGHCYIHEGKYDLAVNDFSQAIKDCYATAYYGRMEAYARLGRRDLAHRDQAIIDRHHYLDEIFGFTHTPPTPDEL